MNFGFLCYCFLHFHLIPEKMLNLSEVRIIWVTIRIFLCVLGLNDTVFDVDHDKERAKAQGLEPNGFNFDGADDAGVDYALNRWVFMAYKRFFSSYYYIHVPRDGHKQCSILCYGVWNQSQLGIFFSLLGKVTKIHQLFFAGRSLHGTKIVTGSTRYARQWWSKTGLGTGLH